jgi:hypothetical protein
MDRPVGLGPTLSNSTLPPPDRRASPVDSSGLPSAAWLDGIAGGTSASVRAEVEPDAAGLSVAGHAQRVLSQLTVG